MPEPGLSLADRCHMSPSLSPGIVFNTPRAAGILFGPDVTRTFLKQEHLGMIVRSHEGPDARMRSNDQPHSATVKLSARRRVADNVE